MFSGLFRARACDQVHHFPALSQVSQRKFVLVSADHPSKQLCQPYALTHSHTRQQTTLSNLLLTIFRVCVCTRSRLGGTLREPSRTVANHREPSRFELITDSPFRGLCNGVSSICAKNAYLCPCSCARVRRSPKTPTSFKASAGPLDPLSDTCRS